MQQLTIGNHTLDLNLISYVDLNYKVQGGSSRVALGLARDQNSRRHGELDRLFFGDDEADQLRSYFKNPENQQNHFIVFPT
ncbi:MAG: hypothetical protein HQM14_13790 [SAR324 cluster bacterium]|nr:hypothetical protein [SAR324 cluster bacterium]